MAGENRTPEYVAKNPQGTVPALALEDGRVMAESTMICEYMDEVFGPTCACCSLACLALAAPAASLLACLSVSLSVSPFSLVPRHPYH